MAIKVKGGQNTSSTALWKYFGLVQLEDVKRHRLNDMFNLKFEYLNY